MSDKKLSTSEVLSRLVERVRQIERAAVQVTARSRQVEVAVGQFAGVLDRMVERANADKAGAPPKKPV